MKPPPYVNHPPRQGGDSWRLKYYKLKPPPHVNHPPRHIGDRTNKRQEEAPKKRPPSIPDKISEITFPWLILG